MNLFAPRVRDPSDPNEGHHPRINS
ncbi:uncharacterized protein METZ01_LOCUS254862 [marine metagenome]|uniref:Uncharacterized protein n=1 Tax=marine metagenome TaxID=408172 RepID=A0A382IR26_9ZZZZ